MEIRPQDDKKFQSKWNTFITQNSSPAVWLQSWEWGEFRQSLGEKVLRLAVFDKNKLVAVASFNKVSLPGGKYYLNCAKGPVFKKQLTTNNLQLTINEIIKEIEKISESENLVFFRISPPYQKEKFDLQITDYKLQIPKILTHLKEPESTLLLNLKKDESEILKEMHHKTRYNIRLAERKDVVIEELKVKDVNFFYALMQTTATRDKINIFSKVYYEKLFALSLKKKELILKIFAAKYKNQILSSIVVVGFGNTATYLYGASSDAKRNLMPNYLIQWHAISWAKKNGYKWYDFWGADEANSDWSGITRFKQGFVSENTGQKILYLGTFDYLLNKKYYFFYRIGKVLRKII